MHWMNSDFQNAYFVVASAHTYDEAYRRAKQQLENRLLALESTDREESFHALVQRSQQSLDLSLSERVMLDCYQATQHEAEFLLELIERLEPFRRYAHLPDWESHQLAQRDEWCIEFAHRIENYLMGEGRVPANELASMRQHPDWDKVLRPRFEALAVANDEDGIAGVLDAIGTLPALPRGNVTALLALAPKAVPKVETEEDKAA